MANEQWATDNGRSMMDDVDHLPRILMINIYLKTQSISANDLQFSKYKFLKFVAMTESNQIIYKQIFYTSILNKHINIRNYIVDDTLSFVSIWYSS